MSSQLNNTAPRKLKMPPETAKSLNSMKIYRKIMYYGGSYQFKQCMKIVGMYGDGLKLPHQVIDSLNNGQSSDEIAEFQWQRLIRELSDKGKLRNCIAVCDIPESMRGTTNETVCIAMGLLISELSEYPWKGKVFSFSDFPKLHKFEGENLRSKCEFMKQHMESAKKLNFGEIYDGVLEIAIKEKLGHHQIPQRIFVFTDKDFDMAFKNDWFDDYAKALYDYKNRGYLFHVPDMVLWNLKGSISKPMAIYSLVKDQDVGMIITGFSSNLLRHLMVSVTVSHLN
ncbi:putative von Willebrand factor, type A [Rosa chinensis]|uniref:Putative von Willebrand factor, type A n=1 Tax=Rosa chinensis TaxID=74649 RepID=A0A2P6PLH2_ROSCH|nr:putative von Willebrand factor, type A [Rosa chinensis]